MDPSLRAAVLGAQDIQTPSSPLGSFPELAALHQSTFQLPQSSGATSALSNQSSQVVAEQEAARKAAEQAAKSRANPNKYTVQAKSDGGYDFFDPEGKQIDIATYAQATGQQPRDIIKNSTNPIDVQYREDHKNLEGYMSAILSKDKATAANYQRANPALAQFNDKGGLDKLLQQFQQNYQRYYVPRSQDPNAWGATPNQTIVPAELSERNALKYPTNGQTASSGIGN